MKKNILLIITVFCLFITSCSGEDKTIINEKESIGSKIEVTINGAEYNFDTFTIEKHFEDSNDKYYFVTAKTDNDENLEIEFDVTLGLTGNNEDNIVGEFNLYTLECAYYAPDIQYPNMNVTINNEEEFIATFEFSNGYGVYCDGLHYNEDSPDTPGAPFGNEVSYTKGSIYLNL